MATSIIDFNALRPNAAMEAYQQGQQNQLAQMQLGQQQQAIRDAEIEREAYKGASSYSDVEQRLRQQGLGKQALALGAAQAKQRADKIALLKDTTSLMKNTATQIMANPAIAKEALVAFGQQTGTDVSRDLAQLDSYAGNPDAIKQWAAGHAVEAEKLLPKFQEFSTPGGGKQLGAVDPLTAKFTATTTMAPQMTPSERANLGVAQGHLTLAQQNAAKPVWNEAGQSWITPPTAKNPAGTVTPVSEIKATKDQQSAIKALTSAGYNPVTGEDTISKLINKSTSGGLQTLSSAAIGHIFGASTEGRRAIAALEGTANQMATDIAGGKLGAGVSNTDREFIVSALGDVANPMKPAGDRLAGWEAAKARMMRTGMIPAPAGAGSAPAAAIPATPKGVDNSIWNAMTPEERALWK